MAAPIYQNTMTPTDEDQRYQAIFDKIGEKVAKQLGATYQHNNIAFYFEVPVAPNPDDMLTPKEIERTFQSTTPYTTFSDIVNEKFPVPEDYKKDNFHAALQDAVQSLSENDRVFLEKYAQDSHPEAHDLASVFEESCPYRPFYDISKSPIMKQNVPIDIIYEPPVAPGHDFAHAPLVILADQQGIERSFHRAVSDLQKGKELDENVLANQLALENDGRSPDSKLVFLASMPMKDCLKLLRAQKEEAASKSHTSEKMIRLPNDVMAVEHDFGGNNLNNFNIGDFDSHVEIPIKHIRLHDDEANLQLDSPEHCHSVGIHTNDGWKLLNSSARVKARERFMYKNLQKDAPSR